MKRWIVFLLLALLLSGCKTEAPSAVQVVTRVQVLYHSGSTTLYRQYTDQQNMGHLLNYLRLLDAGSPVTGIPTGSEFSCKFIVEDSWGEETVYRQEGAAYLSKDNGLFQQIDSTQGSLLYPLLLLLPGQV